MRALELDCTGPDVVQLQQFLLLEGYLKTQDHVTGCVVHGAYVNVACGLERADTNTILSTQTLPFPVRQAACSWAGSLVGKLV